MLNYERADCMRLVVAMEEIVEMLTMLDLSGRMLGWVRMLDQGKDGLGHEGTLGSREAGRVLIQV